jgi:hypothetical protein
MSGFFNTIGARPAGYIATLKLLGGLGKLYCNTRWSEPEPRPTTWTLNESPGKLDELNHIVISMI